MTNRNPFHVGAALAITVVAGYALCTLVFWLFPTAAASFLTALFHGIDFRPLAGTGAFTFPSFVYALLVLGAWAFMLGSIFGWVAGRLGLPA